MIEGDNMKITLVHSHFDGKHLIEVMTEMLTLGAPIIRAVDLGDGEWQALEGCHRIRAAHALGLTPIINEVEYSETVTVNELGLDFQDEWTVAQAVDGWQHDRRTFEFED
jgi:hypothetical protein